MAYMLTDIHRDLLLPAAFGDGFGRRIFCTLPIYHDTSQCQIAIEAGEKYNVPRRVCVKCPVAHILHQRCYLHLSPFLGPSKDRLKYPQPKGSSAFSEVEYVKSPHFLTYLICRPRPPTPGPHRPFRQPSQSLADEGNQRSRMVHTLACQTCRLRTAIVHRTSRMPNLKGVKNHHSMARCIRKPVPTIHLP
jgi:hypothetical protein